jgi:uncharacterized DUF497 family protein
MRRDRDRIATARPVGKSSYKNSLTSHIIVATIIHVKITCDPSKRTKTLDDRGLDFEDAVEVFAGPTIDFPDDRKDYGETRIVTVVFLRGRMMVVVWTPRGEARHIISMRKANEREQARFRQRLEKS